MKKFFIAVLALLLAVSCKESGTDASSFKVSPTQLTFGAEDTTTQTITVEAVNVEWNHSLSSSGEGWVEIKEEKGGILSVTVQKNPSAEQRTASITVKPRNTEEFKQVAVSVIQAGSDNPVTYSLSVKPASLNFEAENAASQNVTVSTEGEGLTWSTEVEEGCRSWITVAETEGAFTVSVSDNPETTERSGSISVIPSEESAGTKTVRVIQKGGVLLPSMSIELSNGATPEEGFVFDYTGRDKGYHINVTATNLKWEAKVEYDSDDTGWINASPFISETVNRVNVATNPDKSKNESPDQRTGRIILTTDAEGIGPFEVKVTQEGKPEFLSTLTKDVDFGTLSGGSRVIIYPNNDYRQDTYTIWDLSLWSDGMVFDGKSNIPFSGTGDRISLYLATEAIDLNLDDIYYLPEGEYTVVASFNADESMKQPGNISSGTFGWSHPQFNNGSWYLCMQDDNYTGDACITGGKMTVSRTDETYTLVFDFVSDAGYCVKGSFEGALNVHVQ